MSNKFECKKCNKHFKKLTKEGLCAYWYYLGGQPTVEDNDSTTAIKIPKSQVFSIEELGRIMTQIKNGGDLNEL